MPPEFELVKAGSGELIGYTQDDHKKYVAFRDKSREMEAGEYMRVKVTYPRNVKFHRKYMAMMRLGFDHWTPEKSRKRLTYKGMPIEKSFDEFRHGVMIQAGYYDAIYDARGRVSLRAKSVSFDRMDDDQLTEVYEACLKVLLERVLTNYTRDDADHAIEQLQRFGS